MSGDIQVGKLVAGLSMDTSGFQNGISSASGALDGFKGAIGKVKEALTALLTNPAVLAAAAIASLIALGKAAYEAFKEIDAAYDAIQVGTGATGAALDGLKESFDNVFKNATYVESADALAATIADLNTYLGVTGEQLEGLATQFSNLEGMGVSASVDTFSQAMNKWGVSADEAGQYLDYFFKVSQDTGVGLDELANGLTQNKATLDLFGFSLQESADLLGAMNKAGFDSSTLQTGLRQLVNQGITTREEFDALIESIKNAGSESEAAALAVEAFGARAGTEMLALIQSGVLDDIGSGFEDISGYINDTAADTADFEDIWAKMGNNVTITLSKLGTHINDSLVGAMDIGPFQSFLEGVEVVFEKVWDAAQWLFGLFGTLLEPVKELFAKMGETFSEFWGNTEDKTGNAVGNIKEIIETLVEKLAEVIDWFFEFIYPMVETFIGMLVEVIQFFAALFSGDTDAMLEHLYNLYILWMKMLYAVLQAGWDLIRGGLEAAIQWIVNAIFAALNAALKVVQDFVNDMIDAINAIIRGINEILAFFGRPTIELLEHVKFELETPEIHLPEFADTGIAQKMQELLSKSWDDVKAEAEGKIEINLTVNGDLNNPSGALEKTTREAQKMAEGSYL